MVIRYIWKKNSVKIIRNTRKLKNNFTMNNMYNFTMYNMYTKSYVQLTILMELHNILRHTI